MWLLKLRRLFKSAGLEALILALAVRDRETPVAMKLAAAAALAYLISPIDLIPDLPLIGWVDDALLLGIGLPYLLRRLPPAVVARATERAERLLSVFRFGRRRAGVAAGGGRAYAAHAGSAADEVEVLEPEREARTSTAAKAAKATSATNAAKAASAAKATKATSTVKAPKATSAAKRPKAASAARATAATATPSSAEPGARPARARRARSGAAPG